MTTVKSIFEPLNKDWKHYLKHTTIKNRYKGLVGKTKIETS